MMASSKSSSVLIKWISDPPTWDVVKAKDIVLQKNERRPEMGKVYEVRYGGAGKSERAPAKVQFVGTYILCCVLWWPPH